jgi:predicted PurR-regulated permease PerM
MPAIKLAKELAPLSRRVVRNSTFAASVSPERLAVLATAAYIAIFAMCVLFLYYGSSVLMPLAFASLLSFVLTPAVRLLKKVGIPKVISVIVVVVLSISAIGGAGFVVGGQISDLLDRIPSYEYNLLKKVSSLRSASVESGALERARSTLHDLQTELGRTNDKAAPPPANTQDGPSDIKPIPVEIHQPPQPVVESTLSLIRPLISPLATTGLIILFLFFILTQREDLRDRFLRLAGTADLQRTTVALDDAGDRLSRFFIIQALLNSAFGTFIGACLWAMGLPNPVLWGFLAGVMRFVPFIGSIIAGVFPIILAAAIDPGWSLVLWTAALFVISEVVAGEVIEPMLYGRNTGLSPVAVVVATLFWTLLWGPVGLILATPMTVCLMVLGKHVSALNFLEVLFGDEPALEPHERLYQRVLAGDGIEAIEVAEQSLKDMPLIQYYDEIAIKALAMAYVDAASGRLSREDISEIKEAVEDVVEGLSEHLDEEPAAKKRSEARDLSGESDVLCIPARNALDEGPLMMLDQALEAEGINAKVLAHSSVLLKSKDVKDVSGKVVVIGYLGAGKTPAFLGLIIRRLRNQMPSRTVILGLWAHTGDAGSAEEWRASSGADHVVSTIQEAARLCAELRDGSTPKEALGIPATEINYENSLRFGDELGHSS